MDLDALVLGALGQVIDDAIHADRPDEGRLVGGNEPGLVGHPISGARAQALDVGADGLVLSARAISSARSLVPETDPAGKLRRSLLGETRSVLGQCANDFDHGHADCGDVIVPRVLGVAVPRLQGNPLSKVRRQVHARESLEHRAEPMFHLRSYSEILVKMRHASPGFILDPRLVLLNSEA